MGKDGSTLRQRKPQPQEKDVIVVEKKNKSNDAQSKSPFLTEPFIEAFYKPHTATILILAIASLTYFSFLRKPMTYEENFKRGVTAMILMFLTFCFVQLRDGVMRRPHPAFWRLVTGVGIVYLMALVFLLFQSRDDARQLFTKLYPSLGVELPERSYADACAIYTPDHPESMFKNLKDTILDEFILAHIVGYIGKALLFRDLKMCWILSLSFEIVEITFQHIMENFKECWWDHVIIDILICNNLGIIIGLWISNKFCVYQEYEWIGIDKIPTVQGKAVRVLQQFTPYYWTSYRWEIFESWKRFLYFMGLLIFMTLVDMNAFFLKFIFWIPPRNPLNTYRLILWFFIGMPAIREYYMYIADPECKRLGANTWLAAGIVATESLIVFKFSTGLFTTPAPPHIWVNWLICIVFFIPWFIGYFFIFGVERSRKNKAIRFLMNTLLTLSMIPLLVMFLTGLPDVQIMRAEFDTFVDKFLAQRGLNITVSF